MSCQEILIVLAGYRSKMIELLKPGQKNDLNITASSEYSFITINITESDNHYATIRFEISDNTAKIESIHATEQHIQATVKSQTWPGLKSNNPEKLSWSGEIIQQVDAADNIASLTVNCTRGDDYHPGNFSKVLLSENHIELQQINYMNAKSLDHKNDYSLRSLVFRIPLTGSTKMITEFTDRSSENNRHCGERIKAAIDWSPH